MSAAASVAVFPLREENEITMGKHKYQYIYYHIYGNDITILPYYHIYMVMESYSALGKPEIWVQVKDIKPQRGREMIKATT